MTQEKRRQMYSIVHYIAEFMDSQRTTSARTINIWRKSRLLSWKKKEFISNVPTFKPKHWQFIIKKQLRVYDIKHYMSTYCWPKLSIQCKSLCFFFWGRKWFIDIFIIMIFCRCLLIISRVWHHEFFSLWVW